MRSSYANLLLRFLEDYVKLCEVWEDHWCKSMDGDFRTKKEEMKAYRHIQNGVQRDLSVRCGQAGITFLELYEIIPSAFVATIAERLEIIEDLREYVKVKYGR